MLEAPNNNTKYVAFIRHVHTLRVQKEMGFGEAAALSRNAGGGGCGGCAGGGFTPQMNYNPRFNYRNLSTQGKVNLMFAQHPLPGLDQIYKYVFTNILNQQISTLPVEKS